MLYILPAVKKLELIVSFSERIADVILYVNFPSAFLSCCSYSDIRIIVGCSAEILTSLSSFLIGISIGLSIPY